MGVSENGKLFWRKKAERRKTSDIVALSMACGHMDFSCCYAFSIALKDNVWLFDTNCFTRDKGVQTQFSDCPVSEEQVRELFDILERNGTVAFVETYKKPKRPCFQILDASTYSLCLVFSDGSCKSAGSIGSSCAELEKFFYRLSEEYGGQSETT